MKVADLPYFVKFIFSCDDGYCFQTSNFDNFQFIIDNTTNEKIDSLYIGQKIRLREVDKEDSYEIYNIKIRHLFDNTDWHRYGVDSESCNCPDDNEWVFSILISIRRINP